MTSIFLAATLLCPISIPPGYNSVKVIAKYSHEFPAGREYVYRTTVPAVGALDTTITAEGHPWHVAAYASNAASDVSKQIANCSSGDAIHIDGFESGDTRFW